ncbi:MAG TPA: hypothetical protein VFC93_19580 [Chloroflexota bacterium]|nr:hypothetical protein [Chloroflexota bacterium]
MGPAPNRGLSFYWPVIFDRGRVSAPRGFRTREEAVAYATLHMAAERVEIVEAIDAERAKEIARRSR